MPQFKAALEDFTQALTQLEQKILQSEQQRSACEGELANVNEICAYLRAEISQLKKDVKRQLAVTEKAGKGLDDAVSVIDTVLESSHG